MFDNPLHIAYFAHSLHRLHQHYQPLDVNRLTLVHFSVHALDLLGVWDDPEAVHAFRLNKSLIIEWIYSLQTTTMTSSCANKKEPMLIAIRPPIVVSKEEPF